MSDLKLGGLFEGYGGLTMGVQAVYGGALAWYSEVDKGALKVLNHRHPDVPNLGDVTAVDWSQVEPVDILTGGSPCQDLSHAGRRAGMTEGTRSNLWVAMREAIAQLRPPMVVWENVGGAFSAAADSEVEPCAGCVGDGTGVHLRALGRVLGDLSSLGYDTRWHALRAADVGAPHGRLRVFVVATGVTGNQGRVGYRDSRLAAYASSTRLRQYRRGAPAQEAGANQGHIADGDGPLFPTARATDGTKGGPGQRGSSGDLMLRSAVALLPTPRVTQAGYADDGRGGKSLDVEARAERWGDYAAAIARWEQALGRPVPAPTQTSNKGNPQLSPAFVEWMMGLPQGHVTDVPGVTRNEALKLLGNGVVLQQCAAALWEMAGWAVAA